jgi:hypothetical protein
MMNMKKFLFLTAMVVMAASPALSQSTNYFAPGQSELDKQRQQEESQSSYNPQNSYQNSYQDFDFGYGGQEEKQSITNQYSDKYKKNFEVYDPWALPRLLPNASQIFYFVRQPGAGPDEAFLRIITPLALTGCAKLRQPVMKIQENPPLILLSMTDAKMELDKTVRYAHYQCDVRRQYAMADLPLNRANLVEKGIKQIILNTGAGGSRNLKIEADEHKITVSASGIRTKGVVSGVPGAGGVSTFWSYPENTIVLTAPATQLSEATKAEITDQAEAAGLVPLTDVIAGFEPSANQADSLYFIDNSGRLKTQINEAEKPVLFETITGSEVYSGANGPYDRPVQIAVFARLPGANE